MVGKGQHPSEAVVAVTTAGGAREELIVDRRSIKNHTLTIGFPITSRGNDLLIELPRETLRGTSRVWVNKKSVEKAG